MKSGKRTEASQNGKSKKLQKSKLGLMDPGQKARNVVLDFLDYFKTRNIKAIESLISPAYDGIGGIFSSADDLISQTTAFFIGSDQEIGFLSEIQKIIYEDMIYKITVIWEGDLGAYKSGQITWWVSELDNFKIKKIEKTAGDWFFEVV